MAVRGAEQHRSPYILPASVCDEKRRTCSVLLDAFCGTLQCQVNSTGNVKNWVPVTGQLVPPPPAPTALRDVEVALGTHLRCAAGCASQARLTVSVAPLTRGSVQSAAAILAECGLVHLVGGAWSDGALGRLGAATAALKATQTAERLLLEKVNLRSNRTELFLPVEPDSPDPLKEKVVPAILAFYLGEPFTLDYVSALDARAGVAGTQDLHPDVPFFPRTSVSVHTALGDVTEEMGPTLFCPCTHFAAAGSGPGGPSFAAAIRHAARIAGSAADRRCLGTSYLPTKLEAGTVTIYDGAVLHAGMANVGVVDRTVLNVNYAAPAGYEVVRNYTSVDTARVQEETTRWRSRSNGDPARSFAVAKQTVEHLPS